jgi:hypothetical protein
MRLVLILMKRVSFHVLKEERKNVKIAF